jgi:hypothetical protein
MRGGKRSGAMGFNTGKRRGLRSHQKESGMLGRIA